MPANTTHPAVSGYQPQDDQIKVWRYMDLPKFVDFLQTNYLHLSRVSAFKDYFEGTYPQGAASTSRELTKGLASAGILTEMTMASKNAMRIYSSYMKNVLGERMYASCWYSGDAENALMWRAYGESGLGLVIQSTYAKLRDNVPANLEFPVFIGQVRYMDYIADGHPGFYSSSPLETYMNKRKEYASEREVRLLSMFTANGPQPPGILVDFDFKSVVESVSIHPDAPAWKLNVLNGLVANRSIEIGVERSSMDAGLPTEPSPVYSGSRIER